MARKKSQVPSVCANRIISSCPLNHEEEKEVCGHLICASRYVISDTTV